jgi:hypothetical protein
LLSSIASDIHSVVHCNLGNDDNHGDARWVRVGHVTDARNWISVGEHGLCRDNGQVIQIGSNVASNRNVDALARGQSERKSSGVAVELGIGNDGVLQVRITRVDDAEAVHDSSSGVAHHLFNSSTALCTVVITNVDNVRNVDSGDGCHGDYVGRIVRHDIGRIDNGTAIGLDWRTNHNGIVGEGSGGDLSVDKEHSRSLRSQHNAGQSVRVVELGRVDPKRTKMSLARVDHCAKAIQETRVRKAKGAKQHNPREPKWSVPL